MSELYYSDEWVTLYHGDCRQLMSEVTADVLVTDPPYGIAHETGWSRDLVSWKQHWNGGSVAGDGDTTARDAVLAWWGQRPSLVFGSLKSLMPARAVLVWHKGEASGMGDLSIPWKPSWELIFVNGEGFAGSRTSGVLSYYVPPRISMGRRHPMEKPVDLLRDLIAKCPRGTIFDPFAGSGTTLRAAKDLGRPSIGIEIEERYCEIAANRLAQEVLAL